MAEPDPDTAEHTARHLLDAQVAAVRELAARRADPGRARDTLTTAERADTAAWTTAQKTGWTDTDLRHVGFTPPTRRGRGRPRTPADT